MTCCPLSNASLWQREKNPLLKLSMPFFNSHLNFHLRRQAKTKWSSLRCTLGISALPTLIIIREQPFSHSPFHLNRSSLLGPRCFLFLYLHNSQMSTCWLSLSHRMIVFVCWVNCSLFAAIMRGYTV